MKKILTLLFILFYTSSLTADPKLLKPNEAFKLSLESTPNAKVLHVKLGDDIFAYKDKFKVLITAPIKQDLTSELKFPSTVKYHEFDSYKGAFDVNIPNALIEKYVKDKPFALKIKWQGCSGVGLCYNPMSLKKDFGKVKAQSASANEPSEQDSIAQMLASGNFFWIILSFFGFGLLLALTPCVFPMIPILSSIIVSQSGEKMTAKRGFFLSLIYVLAMSVAYTIAGILAGVFGANIQASMQNPYVLVSFSGIFVILSFSMFGFYELQMPQFLQNIANKKSDEAKGKGVFGVTIMGFLSALIVGPCVAAPLAGALLYIGQSGNAFLGGLALFFMSIGMGTPLLIIGASAGKFLPKPGFWMDTIKAIFGIMMLGVAIWMLDRIISTQLSLILWSALFIASAIYGGVLEPLKDTNGWRKLLKTFLFMLLLYGSVLFLGAFSKGHGILDPLSGLLSRGNGVASQNHTSEFTLIKTNDQLDEFLKSSNKPVMIDFWASWCVSCKELEIAMEEDEIKKVLNNFALVRIDVSKNTKDDQDLLKRFNLFGPPGIVFFKGNKELKNLRLVGFKNSNGFLSHIKKVLETDAD